MSKEEFKAKLDAVLSERKFVKRNLDTVVQHTGEEAANLLRFCRTNPEDYVVTIHKNKVFLALKERIDAEIEEEIQKIEEAMAGGEEGEEPSETACLQPIEPRHKVQVDQAALCASLSECYLVLNTTLRKIPSSKTRVRLAQVVADLEICFTEMREPPCSK